MDHTENTLRTLSKALTDVIAPALDKKDPLAHEQLRLVVDYIEFVRSRLDDMYGRERFELRHHLALASSLAEIRAPCTVATADVLNDAIGAGRTASDTVGVPTAALRGATARLAAAISTIVREAATMDPTVREKIERRVLEATDERIVFERAWYLPLGFDPAASEVPLLSAVLARSDAAAAPQR
jgi:hypothetical protein